MTRPRAADDFKTIRARMEELRRDRADAAGTDLEPVAPMRRSISNPVLIVQTTGTVKWFNAQKGFVG